MSNELTGAEIFVRCLNEGGVERVFGYPGGAALHIYDALYKQEQVKHILDRKSTRLNSSHTDISRMPSSA